MKKMVLLILGVILSVVALPAPSASGSVACEGTNKKVTINWYGKERVFHIYSPAADSNESRPTVFGFHGATGSLDSKTDVAAAQLANGRGWNFVSMQGAGGFWMLENGSPDYKLLRYVKNLMTTDYCGDPDRVYGIGFSMGAMFVSLVGCQTNIFKAIVPVAGVVVSESGRCLGGTAVRAVHSVDDPTVLVSGSLSPNVKMITPEYLHNQPHRVFVVAGWAIQNNCSQFTSKVVSETKTIYYGKGCSYSTSFVQYSYGKHSPPAVPSTAMGFFFGVNGQ